MTISTTIRELQTLTPGQLAERYEALFGRAPRNRNRMWLLRQVAWKLQEQALGGLPEHARSRLDELLSRVQLPIAAPTPRPQPAPARSDSNAPVVGTVFTRKWHGKEVRVEVVDGGFLANGVVYGSLTAAVRSITNANWNPRIFFGLVKRGAAS